MSVSEGLVSLVSVVMVVVGMGCVGTGNSGAGNGTVVVGGGLALSVGSDILRMRKFAV